MMKLRIATRNSQLALWQTDFVIQRLLQHHPLLTCEKVELVTQGDKDLTTSLAKIGGKGLFLKELEHALLNDEADIAVHSLKDVPSVQTSGLSLITYLARENPQDVLLTRNGQKFMALPKGALVGTSSVRRQCQLQALRPDLTFQWLRGNVPTRINKLLQHEYDAIVLAYAGLSRLQLLENISEIFSPNDCLPAVGQGVIVIQARSDNEWVKEICEKLDDEKTRYCITAERAMHAKLGGSCQTSIGGLAQLIDGKLTLQAMVGTPDGKTILRDEISGVPTQALPLGEQLAQRLLEKGALRILEYAD